MEKRIILFLVLSMAIIVLYPYLMEKMGIAKRPGPATSAPAAKKKDAEPALPAQTTVAPGAPKPAATLPPTALASERDQEVTVETDLVKVVLSNRGGVIKQWELKRFLNTDPKNPKPIQLVPTGDKGVALIPPLTPPARSASPTGIRTAACRSPSASPFIMTVTWWTSPWRRPA